MVLILGLLKTNGALRSPFVIELFIFSVNVESAVPLKLI